VSAADPDGFREIERYTKLFWIHTGPYNNLTARKFVLKIAPERLSAAAHAAAAAGARFPTREGESLDELLARLQPMFFDPAFEPFVTCKTPGPGKDILQASANNLYVGVTMKDLEGWKDEHELNSRLVKRNGRIEEEVYRIGGRYGRRASRGGVASHGGNPFRDGADGPGAARADQVVRDRRAGGPDRV
jgi:dipeptidyl-peptidase-3